MRPSGAAVLSGVIAGVFGALALACVLSLVAPPPSAALRRATTATERSLERSGVTAIGAPTVSGTRSIFDDPAAALATAVWCLLAGVTVGAVLGAVAGTPVAWGRAAAVVVVGAAGWLVALAAADRWRARELWGAVAFWVAAAGWFAWSNRSALAGPTDTSGTTDAS